jgi:LemA protein
MEGYELKIVDLKCPNCNGSLKKEGDMLVCGSCGASFAIDYDESDVEHERLQGEAEREERQLAHEKELLEKITMARTAAMGATTINDKIEADNQLSSALAGLKVSVEAYPDLKANQNFMQLQTELADIENKLASVRRFFNSATKELNNAVQTFPGNLLAGMFGFHKEPMFEVAPEERAMVEKAPTISF